MAGTASDKAGATPENKQKREENGEVVVGRRDVLQLPPVDLFGLFTGVAFDGIRYLSCVYGAVMHRKLCVDIHMCARAHTHHA